MGRSAPLAIESTNLSEHPAALAWIRLGGNVPAQVEVWRRPSRSKPAVYRLIFARPGQPAVFAKRSPKTHLALERMLYQEILPRLPLAAPRYHGACRDLEGATWMFIEDVGDRGLCEDDPAHRALAARWLGVLHTSGAADPAAARLPDAGPRRYLAHLRAGRDAIHRNLVNPWLEERDRPVLTGLLRELDALERRWPHVERACQGLPVTLVHGDFRPKNVRIRAAGGSATFLAIDWEMAGWGIPAADLACAFGPGPLVRIEARTYQETVAGLWRDPDGSALRRASILGRIFQALASTEWACASLVFVSARHLIRPVASLRVYRAQLADAIQEGTEWLGRS